MKNKSFAVMKNAGNPTRKVCVLCFGLIYGI